MSRGRTATRGLGELLVTAGVLLLLFAVYQAYWTNVTSDAAANRLATSLEQQWNHGVPSAPVTSGGKDPVTGVAIMRIPRMHLTRVVVEGVSLRDLAQGIGHYPASAMPGQVGNFAVAGHRATHGQPFWNMDLLRAGDHVYVETRTQWFDFVIDNDVAGTVVEATDVAVVDPVPNRPGVKPTQRLITLTTCWPRWASTKRMIAYGHLVAATPRSAGPPAGAKA